MLLYVDTLEYLKRGGRVGAAAALIGSALAVKPILTITDGLVVPLERVRTQAKALGRLESLAVEKAQACDKGFDIGVQHLVEPDRGNRRRRAPRGGRWGSTRSASTRSAPRSAPTSVPA